MLQIVGTLTGIESRNGGWSAIAILEEGNQYPKKLSTKKAELISASVSLMGQLVTAAYNESESNQTNPHTGNPYVNRYLEAITPGAQQLVQPGQQTQPIQQQQAPAQTGISGQPGTTIQHVVPRDEQREERIMRQSAAKVAADLLPLLSPEYHNLGSLVQIAEQLAKYFKEGVNWDVAPIQTQAEPVGDIGQTGIQGDQAPVHPDDDIPF